MASLFRRRWRSTGLLAGPGGRDSLSQRLLRPCPPAVPRGVSAPRPVRRQENCFLSSSARSSGLSTTSSAVLSPRGPAPPSPAQPAPTSPARALHAGHVAEPTPGDTFASSPQSDCRTLRGRGWRGCSASLHPPRHLGSALLLLRVYKTSVDLLTRGKALSSPTALGPGSESLVLRHFLSCEKFTISAQRLSEHSPATYCRSHARERHLDQSRSAARTPPRCPVSVSLEENSSTKRGTEEAAPGPEWAKLQSCRTPFIPPRTHLLIRLPSWPACSRQPTLPFRCLGRKWK